MPDKHQIVSVIIPTYNRAKYITSAIDSVLSQTYNNIEIIVVDDGSNDSTREVLYRYGNKIRYVYQENLGVSAARNRGIELSKGEWIAFLDSDDVWFPKKLSVQMEHISERPEIDVHVTNVFISRENIEHNPLSLVSQVFYNVLY